ncbi:hypothetical protein AB0M45_25360 [Nocardia sp. NPDC051787]|uniref:hypothetical protein n=1 Tax=Nocardia sp. NPDC051787 TaxID=3155415 RepID=UPI003435354E
MIHQSTVAPGTRRFIVYRRFIFPRRFIVSADPSELMLFRIRQDSGRRLTALGAGLEITLLAAVTGQIVIAVLLAGRVPWLMLSGLVVLTSGVAVAIVLRLPQVIFALARLESALNDSPTRGIGHDCADSREAVRQGSDDRQAATS